MKINLNKEQKLKLEETLKAKNISFDKYVESLIIKELENIYHFENGFYFNMYNCRLYNNEDKEVKLSKKPLLILKCLIENKNEYVSTENISLFCWGNKETKVYTIRNMIKKIRDKSYRDIITNSINKGYKIL